MKIVGLSSYGLWNALSFEKNVGMMVTCTWNRHSVMNIISLKLDVTECLLRVKNKTIYRFNLTSFEVTTVYDLVPKGVHEDRTKGVENKVDDPLKLVVFLECAQCQDFFF